MDSAKLRSSKRGSTTSPVIIEQRHLQNICKILTDYIDTPTIEATFSNEMTREYRDINDVLEHENVKTTRIQELNIRSRQDDRYGRVSIDIGSKSSSGIRYHIELPSENIYPATAKLDEIMEATKPWYWLLAKGSIIGLLFALLLGALVSIFAAFGFRIISAAAPEDSPSISTAQLNGILISGLVGYFGFGILIDRIFSYLFRRSFILVGAQQSTYNLNTRLQWLAISVLATLIISLIFLTLQ